MPITKIWLFLHSEEICLIMRNYKKYIFPAFLLFYSLLTFAQPICKVRTFGTENGLPASVVSGITQSTDNLIWIATWNGLSCFDGYCFSTFRNIPGVDSQLTTNHLISVMPAMNGDLWTTAYSDDVYLFNSQSCQYSNVSTMIEQKFKSKFSLRKIYPLPNGDTWIVGKYNDHYRLPNVNKDGEGLEKYYIPGTLNKVLLDARGKEWLLCDQGAFVHTGNNTVRKVAPGCIDFVVELGGFRWLVSQDGKIYRLQSINGKPRAVSLRSAIGKVNEVVAVGNRHLVMATDRGLLVYDIKTGIDELKSVQWPNNPLPGIDQIFQDSRHRLWCFNDGRGVALMSADFTISHLDVKFNEADFTVSDRPIFHEDSRHTIWVTSKNGPLAYYDEKKNILVPQSISAKGFKFDFIPRMKKAFSDHQGNLWIIYPHNLSLVSFNYSNVMQIDLGQKRDTRSVLQDHEGNILLGTVDGDVVKYSPDGHLLGYLSPDGKWQPNKTTFSFHIYSLYEDRQKRLWIGTKGRGLCCVSGGKTTWLRSDEANVYSLSSDEIYDIKEDTKGRLLVATFEGGLNISSESMTSVAEPSRMKFIHSKNLLKGYAGEIFNKVRRIEVLPSGVVALSTTHGLLTYSDRYTHPDRIRFYVSRHTQNTKSLYSSEVMQTQLSRNGKLYVVTLGGGLQCADARGLLRDNLEFEPVDDKDGDSATRQFSSGTMQSLVADNKGDIWVVGESRITCVGNDGLKEYGADEIGGVNITEALPSHSPSADRIVIATEGGAISFLPGRMDRSSYEPNIMFTSIRYMDRDFDQPIINTPELNVDVDHRAFTLFFSALDYSSHSSVSTQGENCGIRYAYKVDDEDWTYVHPGNNSASFNHFPAGRHTVSVRSTNGDGVWMNNERQLVIYASPTFTESWWGRSIIFAFVVGAIILVLKRYMKKRTAEITEEATEKADAGKVCYLLRKPEVVDEDKAFMDRLLAFIEEHIGDTELKVDDMAVAVSMGRSTFYARLKQIADMSPNDFLRHIRMKRAEDLVTDSQMTFSQIAYAVGFSDPKYFGKCFKKHTGMSPSEYRKNHNETKSELP